MVFEQEVPTAENELIIEKKWWFGKSIRFEIKATSAALPDILKVCDRHLGGKGRNLPPEVYGLSGLKKEEE